MSRARVIKKHWKNGLRDLGLDPREWMLGRHVFFRDLPHFLGMVVAKQAAVAKMATVLNSLYQEVYSEDLTELIPIEGYMGPLQREIFGGKS